MVPAGLGLSAEQTRHVIKLAGAAPSLHNRQPWRFRVGLDRMELHADTDRRLPFTDPSDGELRLGCGAALLNLRLALEHHGVRPSVTLVSEAGAPTLLATIGQGGSANPTVEECSLFRSIMLRRTNRRPFLPAPVPSSHMLALEEAARSQRCWMHIVQRSERAKLLELVHRAHQKQTDEPGFRAELARWTGRRVGEREGVPVSSAGPGREEQDEWVLREFTGGQASPRVAGKDFEDDPLMVVLGSYSSGWVDDLVAGQAMQRMLLTMTSLGLAASFVSQVVEVAETRLELTKLMDESSYPKMVMRVGYGSPVPATARRLPDELFLNDELTELELGPQASGAFR